MWHKWTRKHSAGVIIAHATSIDLTLLARVDLCSVSKRSTQMLPTAQQYNYMLRVNNNHNLKSRFNIPILHECRTKKRKWFSLSRLWWIIMSEKWKYGVLKMITRFIVSVKTFLYDSAFRSAVDLRSFFLMFFNDAIIQRRFMYRILNRVYCCLFQTHPLYLLYCSTIRLSYQIPRGHMKVINLAIIPRNICGVVKSVICIHYVGKM